VFIREVAIETTSIGRPNEWDLQREL